MSTTNVLHIASSATSEASQSRRLASHLITRLGDNIPVTVTEQDLRQDLPLLTEEMVFANFTPAADRTTEQHQVLAPGDALIDQLEAADVLVISVPMYNFGPPAALKAWVDLVVRAGRTFQYGESGPEGLLADRPVYVVVSSGGVPLGSDVDYASGWLTTVLGFIGLTSVTLIDATGTSIDLDATIARATAQIDNLGLLVAT